MIKQFLLCRHNKILHALFLSTILLLLAACSSSTTTTPGKPPTATPAAAAKPTTLPSGTVLYQADSSQGLNSIMHGSTGWKLIHGFLQSDLSNNNVLTSPYVPTVPNYAVEVHFQIMSV